MLWRENLTGWLSWRVLNSSTGHPVRPRFFTEWEGEPVEPSTVTPQGTLGRKNRSSVCLLQVELQQVGGCNVSQTWRGKCLNLLYLSVISIAVIWHATNRDNWDKWLSEEREKRTNHLALWDNIQKGAGGGDRSPLDLLVRSVKIWGCEANHVRAQPRRPIYARKYRRISWLTVCNAADNPRWGWRPFCIVSS